MIAETIEISRDELDTRVRVLLSALHSRPIENTQAILTIRALSKAMTDAEAGKPVDSVIRLAVRVN